MPVLSAMNSTDDEPPAFIFAVAALNSSSFQSWNPSELVNSIRILSPFLTLMSGFSMPLMKNLKCELSTMNVFRFVSGLSAITFPVTDGALLDMKYIPASIASTRMIDASSSLPMGFLSGFSFINLSMGWGCVWDF